MIELKDKLSNVLPKKFQSYGQIDLLKIKMRGNFIILISGEFLPYFAKKIWQTG